LHFFTYIFLYYRYSLVENSLVSPEQVSRRSAKTSKAGLALHILHPLITASHFFLLKILEDILLVDIEY